jgi:hypothetical protein
LLSDKPVGYILMRNVEVLAKRSETLQVPLRFNKRTTRLLALQAASDASATSHAVRGTRETAPSSTISSLETGSATTATKSTPSPIPNKTRFSTVAAEAADPSSIASKAVPSTVATKPVVSTECPKITQQIKPLTFWHRNLTFKF